MNHCKWIIISTKILQSFVNHTNNAIILLKTDLNSFLCLVEIDQVTFLKFCSWNPIHFVWIIFKMYKIWNVNYSKTKWSILKCGLIDLKSHRVIKPIGRIDKKYMQMSILHCLMFMCATSMRWIIVHAHAQWRTQDFSMGGGRGGAWKVVTILFLFCPV